MAAPVGYFNRKHHLFTGEFILSNSKVKELYDRAMGKKVNKARRQRNFDFGTAFHTFVLEPDVFNKTITVPRTNDRIMLERMNGALMQAGYVREYWAMGKVEHECYGRIMGRQFKGKMDYFFQPDKTHKLELVRHGSGSNDYHYKGRMVQDLKTTSAASQEDFEEQAEKFGYDIQTYLYLNMSKSESFNITGVQKSKAPQLFEMNGIDRNHDFYKSGEKKLAEYLEVIKPLIDK